VELPPVYKINLKPGARDRAELVKYCLENSLLGMGWGSHYFTDKLPADYATYYEGALKLWPRRKLGSVRAFHDAAPASLVWFRDLHGGYYLARLVGGWRLLHGERAERLDLANVRDVEYVPVGSEAGVPGAVIRAYGVPSQLTFCRVKDYGARAYSALLASELLNGHPPDVELSTDVILRSLLAPLDVEDLVVAYLQDRGGYVAFPVRSGRSTAVYECVLRNRKDGHTAVVQVKTGNAEVPVAKLDPSVADKWFVYVDRDQDLPGFVHRIERAEIIEYMESGARSLPLVTEHWMRRKVQATARA
jgi:hypothetical protein